MSISANDYDWNFHF